MPVTMSSIVTATSGLLQQAVATNERSADNALHSQNSLDPQSEHVLQQPNNRSLRSRKKYFTSSQGLKCYNEQEMEKLERGLVLDWTIGDVTNFAKMNPIPGFTRALTETEQKYTFYNFLAFNNIFLAAICQVCFERAAVFQPMCHHEIKCAQCMSNDKHCVICGRSWNPAGRNVTVPVSCVNQESEQEDYIEWLAEDGVIYYEHTRTGLRTKNEDAAKALATSDFASLTLDDITDIIEDSGVQAKFNARREVGEPMVRTLVRMLGGACPCGNLVRVVVLRCGHSLTCLDCTQQNNGCLVCDASLDMGYAIVKHAILPKD